MKLTGQFGAVLRDGMGRVVQRWQSANVVTELGEAHVANLLGPQSDDRMEYLAVGTGTGQDETDTTLATELARQALDSPGYGVQGTGAEDSDVGREIRDNELVFKCTLAPGTATGTITEAALFNDSTGGTMFNYGTGFTWIKGDSQPLLVWYVLTVGKS